VDPEQAGQRRTLDSGAREQYVRAFAAWRETTASTLRAARVRYFMAETSEPAAHVVRRVAGEAGVRGR
jgi:hypothetical protein